MRMLRMLRILRMMKMRMRTRMRMIMMMMMVMMVVIMIMATVMMFTLTSKPLTATQAVPLAPAFASFASSRGARFQVSRPVSELFLCKAPFFELCF